MKNADAYNAADRLLAAMDGAPVGDLDTVFKDQTAKDWMETSVHRALDKLDAASYHASNVAHLVDGTCELAAKFAGDLEKSDLPKNVTFHTSGLYPARNVGYEVDAFLAATRASIDFGGSILALHLGMHGRTGITRVLESLKKASPPPFSFLLAWAPWIENLKQYRDECVHYRTLHAQSGYEALRKKGASVHATIPCVVPCQIGKDRPDTRRRRAFGFDGDLPEGLNKAERWGEVRMDDGSVDVLEHSICYDPAEGYVRVEEFCSQHSEKLCEFLVAIFDEALAGNFKFQQGT